MDENLQRLTRELRKETCPQRVLDEVARRISAQTRRPGRFRYGIAGALAGLMLLCGLALWQWPTGADRHQRLHQAAGSKMDNAQIAEQAEGALGCIGRVLLDAGSQSEKVILQGAVPPLRSSLETAKNKIVDHIAL
jgi:ferric-dicitrate binding protein FerR (iron transport regulator)